MDKISKSVTVIQYPDEIIIHANNRTTHGVWIAKGPAKIVKSKFDAGLLFDQIMQTLSESKVNVDHPVDFSKWLVTFYEGIGKRGIKDYMKSAKLIDIDSNEDSFSITPTKNGGRSGKEKGFSPQVEFQIKLNSQCSQIEFIEAVYLSLDRCS